jgi:molybdenum cofactor cytidylyltransferase
MAMHSVYIVVLAAGKSERFGSNKLHVNICGRPLGSYAMKAASECSASGRVAVLRSASDLSLVPSGFNVCYASGQLSDSIRAGISSLPQGACAAILLLADQPLVNAEMLDALIGMHEKFESEAICYSAEGVPRNPVLFPSSMFKRITELSGDRGAQFLLTQARRIECDAMKLIDVDTEEDAIRVRDILCGN